MKKFIAFTALAALVTAGVSYAETIQQTTIEHHTIAPGSNVLKIDELDVNSSGTISTDEIGERLFYIYDQDGNEIIDNVEFDKSLVVSVVPVERETITVVDLNNDGIAEESSYTLETFMEETRLALFDKQPDGLSAKEFIGKGFLNLDSNDDMAIDINEWKAAYIANYKAHDDSETFN